MPLHYPWLNGDLTKKIWISQMRRMKDDLEINIEFDQVKLLTYAIALFRTQANKNNPKGKGPRWDGRQIRNAFQSAIGIAKYGVKNGKPTRLEVSHFEKVVKASDAFDDYLQHTKNNFTDADIARNRIMREDTFGIWASQPHMAQQQQGFNQHDSSCEGGGEGMWQRQVVDISDVSRQWHRDICGRRLFCRFT